MITKTIINKQIIYFTFESQYELCATFMRPQEFYESSIESIRGRYFTLDQFMDAYANLKGNFTYTSDWVGFNLPGSAIRQFFDLKPFKKNLTSKERWLYHQLKSHINDMTKRFYVIALLKNDKMALKHELAHAMFYLYQDYRDTMKKFVSELPEELTQAFSAKLKEMGYAKNVIVDEMHAYMSTNRDGEWNGISLDNHHLPMVEYFNHSYSKLISLK